MKTAVIFDSVYGNTKAFLDSIPTNGLKNIHVAAFDTGISSEGKGFFMRTIINILNYAAKPISNSLEKKGGIVVAEPEGFIVEDREGPLKEGELGRAMRWARGISQKLDKLDLIEVLPFHGKGNRAQIFCVFYVFYG